MHSLGRSSQRLVFLRRGNNLYFSENAGDSTIIKRFRELIDHFSNQTFTTLPDEIQMTFEYNNELYAQLNSAVLSSEDIKKFMNKHSGIVFDDESEDSKSFTREELLIVLKQYLELPVHIRDNLALKRMVRADNALVFNFFSTVLGSYNSSLQTITLFDSAFEKEGTDDKGEWTLLHEIGHSLYGKSVWEGPFSRGQKGVCKIILERG